MKPSDSPFAVTPDFGPKNSDRADAPPGLSVLVVTHRRPAGLRRLIAALAPQVEGRTDREVVVVNDGSHDERYEAVVAEHGDSIRYEALPKNVGVGVARNRAASHARKDFIVYIDDDCEPPPFWLDWVAARLLGNPALDVVAGTTRPLWSGKPSLLERVQAHYHFIPRPWRSGDLDIFVTANVAIRRALFEELGGFAELRAAEDTELSVRLGRAGARFLVDDDWHVRHEVGGRLRDQVKRYAGYGYANAAIGRLATAPPTHGQFMRASWWRLPRHLNWVVRDKIGRSKGFSDGAWTRALSIVLATIIQSAHYVGCIRAVRDSRRSAPSSPAPADP
jgi:glycosyltransferase involved in cell wall biosynthesis